MPKMRVYEMNDKDLPRDLWPVKEVFSNDRQAKESLHTYFTRRGFKCYCKDCVRKRQLAKNVKLL